MKKRGYFFTSTGFLLFLALVLLWIPWLGDTPFYSKGEPREAVVAMSMLQDGDWILPVNFGDDIPYKPPFMAWLIAVFAWIFNGGVVNEFTSRLPSALAAIGMIMMGYRWAMREHDKHFALTMAFVTATSFEVFRAAEACRLDMILTAAIVGAIYIIYEIRERRGRDNIGWWASAAALLTIATLTKGPVGSLLPCLVCGIYLLLRRDNFFKTFGKMTLLLLVSFVLPALWYYAAWKRGGDAFFDLAWEENIGRLTGTMSYESHERPFWYNFVTILAGMLPWTLLALLSLFRIKAFHHWPFRPSGLLAMTAAVTVIAFYCIPVSKRSVYLLPAYPFMAYGITVIATSLWRTPITRFFGRTMACLGILAPVCIAIVTLFYNPFVHNFHFVHWWSWIMLALPVVAAVWWFKGKSKSHLALPVIYLLLLFYNSAMMPAIFDNPVRSNEARQYVAAMQASDKPVLATNHPSLEGTAYWLNFYMNDRMRSVKPSAALDSLPVGTIIFVSNPADTADFTSAWHIQPFGYNPDSRRPAWLAVRGGELSIR